MHFLNRQKTFSSSRLTVSTAGCVFKSFINFFGIVRLQLKEALSFADIPSTVPEYKRHLS
jgi:hypothetical protein